MKYDFAVKPEKGAKAVDGDKIQLQDQVVYAKNAADGTVIVKIDPAKTKEGDLSFLKKIGVTLAHPDDETKSIAEHTGHESFLGKVADFFHGDDASGEAAPADADVSDEDNDASDDDSSDDSNDDDDNSSDSHLFGGGLFGGGESSGSGGFGGFGGGFGGFGGGSFSGGGASSSF